MTTVIRHGGESHFVRPDRVYRTGVLTPIVGFQPQADVMSVAQAFTQGPPSGMQLGYTLSFGPLKTWWLNLKAKIAARKAAAFQQVAGFGDSGAAQSMAQQVAPDVAGRVYGLMHIMNGRGAPATVQQAAQIAAQRRWGSYYWAG